MDAPSAAAPARPILFVDLTFRGHRYRILEGSRDHSVIRPIDRPTFCDGCVKMIPSGGRAFVSSLTMIAMHPGCAIKAGFLDHLPACIEGDD